MSTTWNFTVAHCYGVPQILDGDENLAVLTRLVEHFERRVEEPLLLEPEYGAQMSQQIVQTQEKRGLGDIAALLRSGSSWTVE